MKLLILTRFPPEYEPQRLAEEAKKKGIDAKIIAYDKISLFWEKGKVSLNLPDSLQLADFNLIIPRSSAHRAKKSLVGLKTALITSLPKTTPCLNRQTYQGWPILGKIEQGAILAQAGLPVIPAWFFPQKAKRTEFLNQARFPLICKARFGSHSRRTFRVENKQQAEKILINKHGEFFFQPLIESEYYWRVLVLGGKSLGVMERKTNQRFLNAQFNKVVSGPIKKPRRDDSFQTKLEKLAVKATRVFKAEFTGVDLLADKKGQPLVIEVNRSPQFKIFEKRVSVNVAQKVIEYLPPSTSQ